MPGSFTATDVSGEQAVASSRWVDRQVGTTDCGSGIGPSTSTCAPVPRSCRIKRVRLSIHAGFYEVKCAAGSVPYRRDMLSTTSFGCSDRNRAMI
jgi:hypothetical protein